MKILFLTYYSPFHEVTGPISAGAEIAMRRIAEMLAYRGHEVHYLSFAEDEKLENTDHTIGGVQLHLRSRAEANGYSRDVPGLIRLMLRALSIGIRRTPIIRHMKLAGRANSKLKQVIDRFSYYCWGYRRVVSAMVKKYNIEIVHCFTSMPDSLAAAIVCDKQRIPLSMRVGGRFWYLKYCRLADGVRRYKYLSDMNYVFSNTALFAYNSSFICEETRELFKQLSLPSPAWEEIVDIGVRLPELEHNHSLAEVADFGITETDFVFSCVGKFKQDSKRQDILIKALANLWAYPEAKVVFAGDGTTLDQMQLLAKRVGVSDKVIFLGNISHDKVFDLMRRTDVFVHPTDFEGSSKAVAEAMLCGKAVIASNIPANSEHIKCGDNGLLTENTPYELALQMKELLDNSSLRERLAEYAKSYADEHFNPEQNILIYEELFEKVIAEHQKPRDVSLSLEMPEKLRAVG